MASVFKLAFLASTKNGFCRASEILSFTLPNEVIHFAEQSLQKGQVDIAESAYSQYFSKFTKSETFKHEYISFMLKIGQYEKIIAASDDASSISKAKEYQRKMDSNDIKEICSLISVSPLSLEVNLAMIQSLLLEKKIHEANTYMSYALKYHPESYELFYLNSYILLSKENYNVDYFSKDKSPIFLKLVNLVSKFLSYSNIKDSGAKIQYFASLYKEVMIAKMNVNELINVFEPLFKNVIELIVKTGCDGEHRVLSFARQLKDLDPSMNSLFYYIKSLILENLFKEAELELSKTNELSKPLKTYLTSLLALRWEKFQRKQEEEKERKREEKRRQEEYFQRQQSGHATEKAGKDFLKYYALLGVDKSIKQEALKKAHLKKVKKINKTAANRANLPVEKRDEELKMVNKAFQILSDPQKRKTYDLGIDPETGPQVPNYDHQGSHFFGQYGGQHAGFMDEDKIKDIFENFFGHGQSRGRKRTHTQFIFM